MSYSDEQMHPSQNKFYTFAYKFNTLNMECKDLNRLNMVHVEKKRAGVWIAEQIGVSAVTVSKWSYHSA